MVKLFYLVALPAGVVLRLMVPGSINCILQVNDLNALRTLWQNYQSGLLKKNLEYVLITEDLCKLAKGDEIIMDVFLEEKMYRDVCLELILNQKKGDKVYKEESRQPRRLSYPMREKDKSMFQVYQPPFYHQGCGISPSNQQNDQRIDSKENEPSNAKQANSMHSKNEESLLHSASKVPDVITTKKILSIERDIDSRRRDGATPLMIAAREGRLDAFSVLIGRKSDPTLKDNNGC
ncbi:uncharacterized protein [Montipora capricornis]|uniref:uncharacterized protein isoform X2 n=1 Tax=Montipora capricornis TaxID=246305 RepID=UPI0035F1C745